jgi:hypothetical protein
MVLLFLPIGRSVLEILILEWYLILYSDFTEGCQRESIRALKNLFSLSDYADLKKRFHTCLPVGRDFSLSFNAFVIRIIVP